MPRLFTLTLDDANDTFESRFWAKVDQNGAVPVHRPDLGPCWLWTGFHGASSDGYGSINLCFNPDRRLKSHRAALLIAGIDLPAGMPLDHLCRVRHCVNPSHLEPVTDKENALRGIGVTAQHAERTHCLHGHKLEGENLEYRSDGSRRCVTCRRRERADYGRRRRLPG